MKKTKYELIYELLASANYCNKIAKEKNINIVFTEKKKVKGESNERDN